MKKLFSLKGKTALITGASSGLGKAMAQEMANQGAKIAIFDIKTANKVTKNLKTKSKSYKVDVSNEGDIKRAVKEVKKDFGSIDILVNNAGVFYPTPITETDEDKWDKLISINLKGYFLMAKHVAPKMKKGSKIINIASVAGHHAFANSAAYNSSKGAVIALTKTMATDFSEKGINANVVCPGLFKTPMTKDLLSSKSMKNMIENSVLKKRAGKPKELAGIVVYLASDASNYMTGSVITIDGGWTCHL